MVAWLLASLEWLLGWLGCAGLVSALDGCAVVWHSGALAEHLMRKEKAMREHPDARSVVEPDVFTCPTPGCVKPDTHTDEHAYETTEAVYDPLSSEEQ